MIACVFYAGKQLANIYEQEHKTAVINDSEHCLCFSCHFSAGLCHKDVTLRIRSEQL